MASLLLGRELLPLRFPELPQGPQHWFLGCRKQHCSLGSVGPALLELAGSQGTSLGMRDAGRVIRQTRGDLERKERTESQVRRVPGRRWSLDMSLCDWSGVCSSILADGVGSLGEFPKAGPSAAAAPSCLRHSWWFWGTATLGWELGICSAALAM